VSSCLKRTERDKVSGVIQIYRGIIKEEERERESVCVLCFMLADTSIDSLAFSYRFVL
jgi:hypothetical protein